MLERKFASSSMSDKSPNHSPVSTSKVSNSTIRTKKNFDSGAKAKQSTNEYRSVNKQTDFERPSSRYVVSFLLL